MAIWYARSRKTGEVVAVESDGNADYLERTRGLTCPRCGWTTLSKPISRGGECLRCEIAAERAADTPADTPA